jgi:ABC-type polysaccharide/polyol phosphate export permease
MHFPKSDFIAAIKSNEIWLYLATQDIKLRYRRSKIGPFWITLSMAIFCASLGVVYSQLFKADINEYLPFLSVGFVFWTFMSSVVGESPNLFVDNAPYIKDMKTNPFVILLRTITRHLIILAHNFLIVFGIYIYFGINPGLKFFLVIPAIVLVVLNLGAISLSLSILGARFRDISQITQSMLQVIFFITPITWFPKLLSADSLLVFINPFSHYLNILRSPVLGEEIYGISWLLSLATLFIVSSIAFLLYKTKGSRIPFWV